MGVANTLVSALLQSPLHGLLSRTTDLLRYEGRRSGRQFTIPTQYAARGDEVIILVGRPETKTWWRNFRADRDIEVLIRGRWQRMTARAVVGAEDPEAVVPLLNAYLERFPRATRALGTGTGESQVRRAVIVCCRPR